MTNYYYLASDQKLGCGTGSLNIWESTMEVPGFDYPIQMEIVNGVAKKHELRELLQYIQNHMSHYDQCVVQIANILNSNRVELEVKKKSNIFLHELSSPDQLLLKEGEMLTIKKGEIDETPNDTFFSTAVNRL